MKEIEKLEEAARKYSGVDKIRLAFWEGAKWQIENSAQRKRIEELRDKYQKSRDERFFTKCSYKWVMLSFNQKTKYKTEERDEYRIIVELNAILKP